MFGSSSTSFLHYSSLNCISYSLGLDLCCWLCSLFPSKYNLEISWLWHCMIRGERVRTHQYCYQDSGEGHGGIKLIRLTKHVNSTFLIYEVYWAKNFPINEWFTNHNTKEGWRPLVKKEEFLYSSIQFIVAHNFH